MPCAPDPLRPRPHDPVALGADERRQPVLSVSPPPSTQSSGARLAAAGPRRRWARVDHPGRNRGRHAPPEVRCRRRPAQGPSGAEGDDGGASRRAAPAAWRCHGRRPAAGRGRSRRPAVLNATGFGGCTRWASDRRGGQRTHPQVGHGRAWPCGWGSATAAPRQRAGDAGRSPRRERHSGPASGRPTRLRHLRRRVIGHRSARRRRPERSATHRPPAGCQLSPPGRPVPVVEGRTAAGSRTDRSGQPRGGFSRR
ncbi:MAG: hypothetical protein JWP68_1777 [Modestobacter sp.]|nr:hypothetical protein [Modestobacter sp.]